MARIDQDISLKHCYGALLHYPAANPFEIFTQPVSQYSVQITIYMANANHSNLEQLTHIHPKSVNLWIPDSTDKFEFSAEILSVNA